MRVDLYIHDGDPLDLVNEKLDVIIGAIGSLHDRIDGLYISQGEVMLDLSALAAEVESNVSATASVIAVVDRLADELEAAAGDPAAVAAIAAQLRANNEALGAAVAANTPAEEPAPEPVPEPGDVGVPTTDPAPDPEIPAPDVPDEQGAGEPAPGDTVETGPGTSEGTGNVDF